MTTKISVVANGVVEVCEITEAGGGNRKHYRCFVPGQDVSGESAEIQAACAAAHTPAVIAAWQALQPAPVVLTGNAAIDAQIAAIEQANPITHRTQREFMIGVQTMLAGLLNITAEQLLDPQGPHYSHAYAKFVSVNNQTVSKRQERTP